MTTLKAVPDQPNSLTDLVATEVRVQMTRIRMTQTQLAGILGLPQSAVSNRLRGKVPFTVDELQTVSSALGVHPATLLGGHGQSPTPPTTTRYSHDFNTLSDFISGGNLLTSLPHDAATGAMRTARVAA